MEKNTILFAGPSLYGLETKKYEWLDICGPACQSDIYSIINYRSYKRIILADGLYKSIPAPWHKEILMALEMNIEVYGVASLGALRAAELDVYGMKGSGQVYEYIRSNIVDDSEVAVVHKPERNKWEAMTLAHVEVKYWGEEMRRQGKITNETYEHINNWSRQTNFERRTKKGLIKEMGLTINNSKELILETWFSQKQLDLAKLLENLDKKADEKPNKGEIDWNLANTPYIYRQISKDTSLLPFQNVDRDYGDTLINFLIFIFLRHKSIFQEILLKIYIEYIQMELTRLGCDDEETNYNKSLKLYNERECFLMKDQFGQEDIWIHSHTRTEQSNKDQEKMIEQELRTLNKSFKPRTNVAKELMKDLYKLIVKHKDARSVKIDKKELLSGNIIVELNKTVLTSLMKGEGVEVEARQAIYCSKQLISSCSIYTHHGRLRMHALLSKEEIYDELMKEWKKILVNKGKGKPHAFYNEEIDHTKLREKIKDLNEEIKEIQPLPVDNITESQELLFLEADSIAIIKYTIGNK